jgi:hypothetical protein
MKAGIWMVVMLMGATACGVTAAENNSGLVSLTQDNLSQSNVISITQRDIENLCTPDEIIFFSCKLPKNKFVSLCGNNFRNTSGTGINSDTIVKYRYGRPDKIELEFPRDKEKASDIFEANIRNTPTLQVSTLRFNNNGIIYTVGGYFSFRSNPPVAFNGVEVKLKDNKEIKMACDSEPMFTPDFEELAKILVPIPKRH